MFLRKTIATITALMMSSSLMAININIASKEELTVLNGIGPKLADRIIDYRTANEFQTIDDIKNVKGIGEKKFETMQRDLEV